MSEQHPIPTRKNFRNLTGQRFGKLLVVHYAGLVGPAGRRSSAWFCKCDCGGEKTAIGAELAKGYPISCGCLARSHLGDYVRTHGQTYSPTWNSWDSMISRCHRPKGKAGYKGRGIKVCDRWRESFENFRADMGERPEGTTLDRTNNDGDYEPGNCKWSTGKEQMRNRRTSRLITFRGETLALSAWSERTGLRHSNIWQRIQSGWSIERSLTTPASRSNSLSISRGGKGTL